MERVSPTVLSIPLADLSLGTLEIPELTEVDVELEVVDPGVMPGIGLHPNASEYVRSLATPPEDVVLALRSNDPNLDVVVEDTAGRRHSGRLSVAAGASSWCSHRTWTGEDLERLLITIPSTLVARRKAVSEVAPAESDQTDPGFPPPDWSSQLALLDRFEKIWEGEPDRSLASRRMATLSRVRESLSLRRENWPHEPPDQRLSPVDQLDDIWGRSALLDALEAAEAAGRSRRVEPFAPAVRAVSFTGMRAEDVPLGVSHLHGYPHLPDDFDWPSWDCPGYDGPNVDGDWRWYSPGGPGPLTFVAQINLEEARPDTWWSGPRDGWLLFFVDFDRLLASSDPSAAYVPGAHRVAYVSADADLHAELPPWDEPVYGRWGWMERDAQAGLRYVGYGYPAWLTFELTEVVARTALQREHLDRPEALPEGLRTWLSDALYRASRTDRHWLGGEPNPCQEDPLGEALRIGMGIGDPDVLEGERCEWIQLLQLASDRNTDTTWGDNGLLHFFVRADDLEGGRFDRTLLTFQCS